MRISLKPFWRRGSGTEPGAAMLGAGALRWWRPTQAPVGGPDSALESALESKLQPALESARDWPDTQPYAHDEHAQATFEAALRALSLRPAESLALSVHIPFCAAHCLFCERDIHAAQPADVIGRYVDALAAEIALLACHVGRGRDVLQLHLGGGSANELSERQLIQLVDALRAAWRLPSDAEMSVECDPRRVSRQHLEVLHSLGFRQLTFGVADLDGRVQQAIGRCNSAALIDDVCLMAQNVGFERVRLELLIGLPHQSESTWRATLARLVAVGPHRVRLGDYRHQPCQTPAQLSIDPDALPDAAGCARLRTVAMQVLQAAGYLALDAGHFVLDDDELALARAQGRLRRSLLGYTATPEVPQLGVGAGATGAIDGNRFQNHTALGDWQSAVRAQRLPVMRAHAIRHRTALHHGDPKGEAPRWLS